MNATRFILDSNHVKPVNHLQGLNTHNTEEFLRLGRKQNADCLDDVAADVRRRTKWWLWRLPPPHVGGYVLRSVPFGTVSGRSLTGGCPQFGSFCGWRQSPFYDHLRQLDPFPDFE